MGLCVLEGTGGGSSMTSAKEAWTNQYFRYIDKTFNLGNPAGSNTLYRGEFVCDMDDVLPTGVTLSFAVIVGTGSTRGGQTEVLSVSGRSATVSAGYSYGDNIIFTLRGCYFESGAGTAFQIKNVTHEFDVGNPAGGNTTYRKDIECTMDTVLPVDAVILGQGFKKLGNRTGLENINGRVNRTSIVNVGYSYGETVFFTLISYYV